MPVVKKTYSSQLSREDSSGRRMTIPLKENQHTSEEDPEEDTINRHVAVTVDPDEPRGIWRGPSYDFISELDPRQASGMRVEHSDSAKSFDFQAGQHEQDPPSKLIGEFLEKQKKSGQSSIDIEMDELGPLWTVPENQTDNQISSEASSPQKPEIQNSINNRSASVSPRVQFESSNSPKVQIGSPVYNSSRRNSDRSKENDPADVLKCSGRASPTVNLLRLKTKSRLIDPPPPQPGGEIGQVESGLASRRRSGRSGQVTMGGKTGMLEKLEEEEDDPFKDEDLPNEFNRVKCGKLFVLQVLFTILSAGAVVCSVTVPRISRILLWDLHLWKWFSLALAVCCGRLISGFLIRVVVFCCERNFLLRKKVLYFVYGLKSAVQNCLWLGIVLLAWHYLLDKKLRRETKSKTLQFVNKALLCLVVGTIIWLFKTLLVKVLAMSFHVSSYFDRIQEALFNQYVLETLSGPPLIEIERIQKEEEKLLQEVQGLKEAGVHVPNDLSKSGVLPTGRTSGTPRGGGGVVGKSGRIGKSSRSLGMKSGRKEDSREEEGITIDQLHKFNQKNISAWNMKRLMNIVRVGFLSTLDETFHNNSGEDETNTQIRSEWEAKNAAKKIFKNVAKPGAKYIGLEDLMRYLPEKEAARTMGLFEGARESNRVTKSALKNWAVSVFRERRALALTLNDTKTAVKTLHHMVNVVVGVVIVVISLLILEIATTHILVVVSSQLLLVVFMFGNTCKTVFESIIFLFVMHPFDVGDRCSIEGTQMVVEEMNILTTVFLRYDNEKIYFPNTVLATKPISNFYRSPDMGDTIDFSIHMSTPMEKLSILKERLKTCIENKPEHWYTNPLIVLREVEDMNRIKISVWIQHKMNHQDMGEKWVRRSHLMEEMVKIFKELDVEYRMLPMDVNLRTFGNLAASSTRLPSAWMNHLTS